MQPAHLLSAATLALCMPVCLMAASASAETPPTPLRAGTPVDLAAAAWRTHCIDSNAAGTDSWQDAAFDDSAWLPVDAHAPLPQAATPTPGDVCWYRAQIQIDPALKAPAISIERAVLTDYQLFVDGHRIGSVGGLPPQGGRSISMTRVYPLAAPVEATGKLTIAVKLWRFGLYGPINALPGLPFVARLGGLPELTVSYQNQVLNQLTYILLGGPVIGLLVGSLALGLFAGQRARKEYLWLGVYGVSFMGAGVMNVVSFGDPPSAFWAEGIVLFFTNLILIAFVEFFLAFLGRKPGGWMRAYEATFIFPCVLGELGAAGKMDVVYSYLLSNLLFVPGTVLLGALLFVEYRRRNPEAAILIVPTLLAVGTYDLFTVLNLLGQIHVNVAWFLSVLLFHLGFLPYSLYACCLNLFWISMCIIILRRTLRDTKEKARLAGEFDAARSVQQLLIANDRAASPATAGGHLAGPDLARPDQAGLDQSGLDQCGAEFLIDSIYLPASEVGGDFYQVTPADDGSLLIVVGDVSGKGLRAAMTVSTIVGALRGSGLHQPGKVLAHLNHVLAGQISGFVTCCAAHISADGVLTLANAGHIPPYCNGPHHDGEELPAESGLPLGIVAEATYEEVRRQLGPEDSLTFVSDGVIEATNRHRQLFGFERTRQMSNQSARQIAEAARAFGQEDDITVLTVARTAKLGAPCPGT